MVIQKSQATLVDVVVVALLKKEEEEESHCVLKLPRGI